jgi:signal transduction histidine kinase
MARPTAPEVERTRRHLALLCDVAELIATSREATRLLEQAAELVVDGDEERAAFIYLRSGARPEPTLAASAGSRGGARHDIPKDLLSWSVSAAIDGGVSARIDDTRETIGEPTAATAAPCWQSAVAVPIATPEAVLGMVLVTSASPRRFDRADERLLAVIGRQLGVGLRTARLADHARHLDQQLQVATSELGATVERLRSAQDQVTHVGKLSALGQLVAGVAHELNNPLTSVMGYAQLVQQQLTRRPAPGQRGKLLQDDVAHILLEAERAARIVRNLLLFARRQTAARAEHDVAFLCEQVLELRAYDLRVKGIEIATEFAADLPPVLVDGSQIQQALLNLVLNAEHALSDCPARRLSIRGSSEPACGALRLEIRDTGRGIDPAILHRVFDPFFTTRPAGQGTGLGLSIVSGIVRDHGGEVWVESERTFGTSFFVRLPAVERRTENFGSALVGSIDPVVRDSSAAALAAWGFPVTTASTAREALDRLREEPLQLVIVDRTVVEPDLDRWRETWRDADRVLIAVSPRVPGDPVAQFLLETARQTVDVPLDLCRLRRAVVAATRVADAASVVPASRKNPQSGHA